MTHTYTRLVAALFTLFVPLATSFAVGVKPLRSELAVDPGGRTTATITIINSEESVQRVAPEVIMYDSHDLAGFPQAADITTDDPDHIDNWISFSERELTLAPFESREVEVTVRAPRGAEPGGRYGSIVYAPILDDDAPPSVQVQPRVASLLLITVAGDEVRSGTVRDFALGAGEALTSSEPLAFVMNFENTGTVHLRPEGEVTLTRADGTQLTEVARYIDPDTQQEVIADSIPVNLIGGNVLPGSSRNFRAIWNNNIESGSFTATLSLAAGEEDIIRSIDIAFDDAVEITDMDFVSDGESGGGGFDITIKNSGTVAQQLTGSIDVLNAFQFKLDEIQVPDTLAHALPGETATVHVPWMTAEVPDGSYEAVLHAELGVRKEVVEYSTSFNVGFDWLAGIGLGGVALAGAAGVYVFLRRRNPQA